MHIAVIGTGNLGRALALALLAAGHRVTVWNRTRARVEPLSVHGVNIAAGVADAIAATDAALLATIDGAATRAVLLAPDARAALPGKPLLSAVVMTPEEILELHAEVRSAGGRLSEACILSYPDRVVTRNAECLLAAVPEDRELWRRLLGDLGSPAMDVGMVGNASRAAMGLWLSATFATLAVGYTVAAFERLGLPLSVVTAVLGTNSTLAIPSAGKLVPAMQHRHYDSGNWSIDNHCDALARVIGFTERLQLDAGPFRSVHALYARASAMGFGSKDVSALYEAINPR